MFGLQGIGLYVYRKIIRFWLFFIFVKITPSSFRQSLKQIKQGLKFPMNLTVLGQGYINQKAQTGIYHVVYSLIQKTLNNIFKVVKNIASKCGLNFSWFVFPSIINFVFHFLEKYRIFCLA
jgi:hypothetical protein